MRGFYLSKLVLQPCQLYRTNDIIFLFELIIPLTCKDYKVVRIEKIFAHGEYIFSAPDRLYLLIHSLIYSFLKVYKLSIFNKLI